MQDVMPWMRMDSAAPSPASVAASMRRTPFFFSTTDWMSVFERRMSEGSTPGAYFTFSAFSSPDSSASMRRPRSGWRNVNVFSRMSSRSLLSGMSPRSSTEISFSILSDAFRRASSSAPSFASQAWRWGRSRSLDDCRNVVFFDVSSMPSMTTRVVDSSRTSMRVSPSWIRSPAERTAGSPMREPFSEVPLREPRSTRRIAASDTSSRAWTRESVRSASGTSFVDERPSVSAGRSSRIRRAGSPAPSRSGRARRECTRLRPCLRDAGAPAMLSSRFRTGYHAAGRRKGFP